MFKKYPGTLRNLVVFNKMFLQSKRLHETYSGGCGSYLLTILGLYFLEQTGYDPEVYF